MEINLNINVRGGFTINLPEAVVNFLAAFVQYTPQDFTQQPEGLQPERVHPTEAPLREPEQHMPFPVAETDPTPEQNPEPAAETPKKTRYTAEFIRSKMNEVRDRLEFGVPAPGEAKGPNETADPAIHKELTQWFMKLSKDNFQVKPTELVNLPDAQTVVPEFIALLDTLYIYDGHVTNKAPF